MKKCLLLMVKKTFEWIRLRYASFTTNGWLVISLILPCLGVALSEVGSVLRSKMYRRTLTTNGWSFALSEVSSANVIEWVRTSYSFKNNIVLTILFLNIFCVTVQGRIIGSETALSVEPTALFPAADTDNTMLGFAAFNNGFLLEDPTTNCVFNDYFPFSGFFGLNGGTLQLAKIMNPDANTLPINGGTVDGLSISTLNFPLSADVGSFPTFGQLTSFCFQKDLLAAVPANALSLDVSYDNKYLAAGLTSSTAQELLLYSVEDGSVLSPISMLPAGGEIGSNVNCVRWHPSSNYLAVCCSTNSAGKEIRIYQKTAGSFIKKGEIELGAYHALSCAWHPSGLYLVVGTSDPTRALLAYSFNPTTGALAQVGVKPITGFVGTSRNGLTFSPDGSFLAVGLPKNTTLAELMVYTFADGWLDLIISKNLAASVESVAFDPTGTMLATAQSGVTSSPVRLYAFDSEEYTLTQLVASGEVRGAYDVKWDPMGVFLAVAYQGGAVGTANAWGTVQICAPVNAAEVGGYILVPFMYSMGKTTANTHRALCWRHDGAHLFSCDAGKKIENYKTVQKPFTLKNCTINFAGDINLLAPVAIEGVVRIKGTEGVVRIKGTEGVAPRFFMQAGGMFVIAPNATLIIDNITIYNAADIVDVGPNVVCQDNTGILRLKNSSMVLSDDFTFAQGSLHIEGNSIINGDGHTFKLASTVATQILENAIWTIGQGVILSYEPTSLLNNLLLFAARSSVLHFNSGILHVSVAGLQILYGTTEWEGTCYLSTDLPADPPVDETKALVLGDGVLEHNPYMAIMPLSSAILTSGYFISKAVDQPTPTFYTNRFSIFQLNAGTYGKTYHNVNFDPGEMRVSYDATIYPVEGVTITGNVTYF